MTLLRIGISACVERSAMPRFLKVMYKDIELVEFPPDTVIAGFRKTESGKTDSRNLKTEKLSGYIIVKAESSSGNTPSASIEGDVAEEPGGIHWQLLIEALKIPVIGMDMLNNPVMADRFLQRAMLADAFYRLPAEGLRKQHLTDFYAAYKLLLMAYSPAHYRLAGKLLGNMNGYMNEPDIQAVKEALYVIMFDGFANTSSRARQTNALMHIQGYFKKYLQGDEKQELNNVIGKYYRGVLPLSAPIALLKQHLLKHPDRYLSAQKYFMPYSNDYGLREHL